MSVYHDPFSILKVLKIEPQAPLPKRAHPEDAGLDLHAFEGVRIEAGEGAVLRTAIAIALPVGYVGMIADRSSMAKRGIKTLGGVIDAGYRGEIRVVLWNLSKQTVEISAGDRIAQLLTLPIATPSVVESESLDDTSRGSGGFGSSGR